jgi:exodeoxyribonuclease-3
VRRPKIFKIATFNINNINSRLQNLLEWLAESKPHIVCLQELKSAQATFPENELVDAGYRAVWRGQKAWNGVAVLSRVGEPIVTRNSLPGDQNDHQSRYIEAAVAGMIIGCIYLPNGNPQPGPKFDYKLQWFKRLSRHAKKLWNSGHPVVLAGDYNVVATEQDIYSTKSWDNDALLQPESRTAYRKLLSQGWDDAIRTLFPDERIYTFWDYKRKRWERDAGLRLDHLLLSKKIAKRLIDGGVDREVRGRAHASDHAPTWIKVKAPSLT